MQNLQALHCPSISVHAQLLYIFILFCTRALIYVRAVHCWLIALQSCGGLLQGGSISDLSSVSKKGFELSRKIGPPKEQLTNASNQKI